MKAFRIDRAQNVKDKIQTSDLRPQSSEQRTHTELFREELKELKHKSLLRHLTCIESSQGPRITIKGNTFLNFSSNDYLNLSGHGEVVKAACFAMQKYGVGSGSSRLLSGTIEPHVMLERTVARFKDTHKALVFNTGYAANTGLIPVITDEQSVIFSDELNHASIIDGARLSKAETRIYKHNDISHLEELMKTSLDDKSILRRLIVTETVFSMDGDIAPLRSILKLSKKYKALLIIDDAHGTGVLGNTGRGGLEHFNIKDSGIVQMGTLSKAVGCFGAFVAGKKSLIDLLVNRSKSFMYSTALPPAVAAAAAMALHIINTSSSRLRKRLWRNRERLFNGLEELGFDTLQSETPIIPILTGNVKDTLRFGKYLYKNNIYAPAIRPPTVPEDTCRIRFSVTAGHTSDDIDRVIDLLRQYK
ncbi:MAG: 8-amino-7-oxononanoate synthase [Nitrospiraceae bacterium]|nr:MAG: 8-amino-7-oxononanoate synthase [Nitrospiraceae bacterium]